MGIERLTSSLLMEANKESAEIVKAAESHVQKMVAEEHSKNEELAKKRAFAVRDALLAAGGSSLIANWVIIGLLLRISDSAGSKNREVATETPTSVVNSLKDNPRAAAAFEIRAPSR